MRQGWAGPLSLITQLGLTIVLSILLGLVLGLWVDAHFGTKPWATLILSLLGIVAGSFGVYRLVATSIDHATAARRPGGSDDQGPS
jgi:F0F1-type ATP synthase assembly protein I